MARPSSPLVLPLIAVAACTALVLLLSGSWTAAAVSGLAGLFAATYKRGEESAPPAPAEANRPPEASTRPDLQSLIGALPDPALIIAAGRIALANRAALLLLGKHVVGEDVRLAIRHPAVTEYLFGGRAGTEPVRMELVGIGATDQSWLLRIAPLSATHQLVLLSDQSALQAAERMRVDFVANASHELRTPLAGILGFIETLKDGEAGSDTATRERFLSIMEGEARRMQRLIEDLISLSRIEADKFRLPDRTVDLAALVRETSGIFHANGNARARDLVVAPDLADAQIRGDDAQISQLLHNLISNALKYGRPGTPVTVAIRPEGAGTVRLTVTDEGDGIAPDHLPRLTERFYRIDSSRSRAIGGTGLGLAIVKHIVERHRGRLQIDSTVGRGTTVSVILPLADASAPETKS
jgi:two-component system phosphate regulon sensor histidine kinase PhoR